MYHIRKNSSPHDDWNKKKAEYKTDLTSEEVRDYGESYRYGRGGRWEGEFYIAINGHKSRGGVPVKLQTADGVIPISPTDTQVLSRAGIIRAIQAYKNLGNNLLVAKILAKFEDTITLEELYNAVKDIMSRAMFDETISQMFQAGLIYLAGEKNGSPVIKKNH